MLNQIFVTKLAMDQAWTKEGRRLPITRCKMNDNKVVGVREVTVKQITPGADRPTPTACRIIEVAYGDKKLKQMTKPLRSKMESAGFQIGAKQFRGLRESGEASEIKAGDTLNIDQVMAVGDVVEVQGTSKGKGFAGVVKRHGFAGGPKTHGQSDRHRAPGSIGQRTRPGRVFKGLRMAGHMGDEIVTVSGLTIVYIDKDKNELWLSGPVPGANQGTLRLTKTGKKKEVVLDRKASGLGEEKPVVEASKETAEAETIAEVTEATTTTTTTTTDEASETAAETKTEEQKEETKENV